MIHSTGKIKPNIVMMWCDPRCRDLHEIKFVAKKDIDVVDGDCIYVGPTETPFFYVIESIKERRSSTVSGYNYVTASAIRKRGEKVE